MAVTVHCYLLSIYDSDGVFYPKGTKFTYSMVESGDYLLEFYHSGKVIGRQTVSTLQGIDYRIERGTE